MGGGGTSGAAELIQNVLPNFLLLANAAGRKDLDETFVERPTTKRKFEAARAAAARDINMAEESSGFVQ